jgi:hypothetical protein
MNGIQTFFIRESSRTFQEKIPNGGRMDVTVHVYEDFSPVQSTINAYQKQFGSARMIFKITAAALLILCSPPFILYGAIAKCLGIPIHYTLGLHCSEKSYDINFDAPIQKRYHVESNSYWSIFHQHYKILAQEVNENSSSKNLAQIPVECRAIIKDNP